MHTLLLKQIHHNGSRNRRGKREKEKTGNKSGVLVSSGFFQPPLSEEEKNLNLRLSLQFSDQRRIDIR
jgi:hypothetical protein